MHIGLTEGITKFYFQGLLSIKNTATRDQYNFTGVDIDNDNLGIIVQSKLNIDYIKAERIDDMKGIDAFFQMGEDFLCPFDFKSGAAQLKNGFSLYLRDFIKDLDYKGIFYFKKVKSGDKHYYGESFFYLSPKQFAYIKKFVLNYFQDFSIISNNMSYHLAKQHKEFPSLKEKIESNNCIVFNKEKGYRIYINLQEPNANVVNSRVNKPISESIQIAVWCPSGSFNEYEV